MDDAIGGLLKGFLTLDGVSAAVVVGRDGFILGSEGSMNLDIESLGAIVASGIGAAEAMGVEFDLGRMGQYFLEFPRGRILVAAMEEALLVVVMEADAPVGSVRYGVRQRLGDLAQTLK